MRFTLRESCLPATVLFISAHAIGASTTSVGGVTSAPSTINVRVQDTLDATTILESLRHDVAIHPNDFVTFETRTTANHFILDHEDAFRETNRRINQRGILGYWRGKMLVVLPSLSISNHL
jgi:hypothetical protein